MAATSLPTAATVQAAQAQLQERRASLQARLRRMGAAVVVATHTEGDEADLGTAALEREQNTTQIQAARTKLSAVDAALARIEGGTYGVCTRCHGPIDPERLEALPATPNCRSCTRR